MFKIKPKTTHSRIYLALGVGFLFIVFLAGFIPIDLPVIKNKLTASVTSLTLGDTLLLETLSFSLWNGVKLSGVNFQTGPQNQTNINAKVPEINVSYSLLPLLWGHFQLDKITIVNPEAEVKLPVTSKKKTSDEKPSTLILLLTGDLDLELPINIDIKKLNIKGASFIINSPEFGRLQGQEMNLNLKIFLGETIEAKGKLSIGSLWVPKPFLIKDFTTDIYLSPQETRLSSGAFKFCGGNGLFHIITQPNSKEFLEMQVSLKKLDLGTLMKITEFKQGTVAGKAGFAMNIRGPDTELANLKGQGSFEINDLTATGLPLQKNLSRFLFMPKLNKLEFKTIRSSLILKNKKLTTPDLKGYGNILNFNSTGWVNLDKYTQQKVHLSFSRDFCSRLPKIVSQGILLPGEEGRCDVKSEISGPLADLNINFDKKLKQNVAREAIKGGLKTLKKFFR